MTRTREVRETTIQKRDDYIHIETLGCIVNIYPGDYYGYHEYGSHTTISVITDGDRFVDGHIWEIESTPVSKTNRSADIRIKRIGKCTP